MDTKENSGKNSKNNKFSQSNKQVRSKAKAMEKTAREERELSKQLFDGLTQKIETEIRPQVRQFYLDNLEELKTLMKQQEKLREKWISRLDLYKNLMSGYLKLIIELWLRRFESLNVLTNAFIGTEIEDLPSGDTELQFLLMATSSKLTKLIIKISNRHLMTLDILLNGVAGQFGATAGNGQVMQVITPLAEQLTEKGDALADTDAYNDLKERMKHVSTLWNYIDAEREKRVKYLPNLQVDQSNLLPAHFSTDMDLKKEFLEKNSFLGLDRETAEVADIVKNFYIYLDATHRLEMAQITDMLDLLGYMAKRAVLFPILEQKEASRKICSVCLKQEEVKHLWLCGACLGVTYCGRGCQEVDWPQHQVNCGPSKLDNIDREERLQFQNIDEEAEIQLKRRVSQFYHLLPSQDFNSVVSSAAVQT